MPSRSLDLRFAPEHDAAVRRRWDALAAAGLPSLARHRGSSHAPHLTVLDGPGATDRTVEEVIHRLQGSLPLDLPRHAVIVLGEGPFVLAEHVVPPPVLARVLAGRWPENGRPRVAHLTLARGMTATQVGQALAVLAEEPCPEVLTAVALGDWDPVERTLRTIGPGGQGSGAAGVDGPGRRTQRA